MPGSIEQRGRRQIIEFTQIVKMVCLKMGSSIEASVVRVLKKPGCKSPALGIELTLCPKNVKEDPLNSLFRFAVIPQYDSCCAEHQRAVPFEQNCQRIVTSRAQRCHEICIRKGSKPRGGTNQIGEVALR